MAQALVLKKRRDSIEELRRLVKHSHDEAQKTRIRAIISIKEGVPRLEVSRRFAVCRNTIMNWVTAYNTGGVSALTTNVGGRPKGDTKWNTAIFTDLAKEIDKGGYWSIPRMMEWIKEQTQEDIPEQTVWYRMDKLGYSYKGARPHPMQGDRERQETFKKGALPRSWSR